MKLTVREEGCDSGERIARSGGVKASTREPTVTSRQGARRNQHIAHDEISDVVIRAIRRHALTGGRRGAFKQENDIELFRDLVHRSTETRAKFSLISVISDWMPAE